MRTMNNCIWTSTLQPIALAPQDFTRCSHGSVNSPNKRIDVGPGRQPGVVVTGGEFMIAGVSQLRE